MIEQRIYLRIQSPKTQHFLTSKKRTVIQQIHHSAYSKIFITGSDVLVAGPGDINQVGNTILVSWTTGQVSTQIMYDIFVGFDGSTPTYLNSTASNSYSFLKNGTESVRVVVQISSINPVLADVIDPITLIRTNHLEVYSQTKDLV